MRKYRTRIVSGLVIAVIVALGLWLGGMFSGPPALSAACKSAVAAQNAYVQSMTGTADGNAMGGIYALAGEAPYMAALKRAHCPGITVIDSLHN
jgi:hypothetical protein